MTRTQLQEAIAQIIRDYYREHGPRYQEIAAAILDSGPMQELLEEIECLKEVSSTHCYTASICKRRAETAERELATARQELAKRDKCSYKGAMRDCPTHGESEKLAKLRDTLTRTQEQLLHASECLDRNCKQCSLIGFRLRTERALAVPVEPFRGRDGLDYAAELEYAKKMWPKPEDNYSGPERRQQGERRVANYDCKCHRKPKGEFPLASHKAINERTVPDRRQAGKTK